MHVFFFFRWWDRLQKENDSSQECGKREEDSFSRTNSIASGIENIRNDSHENIINRDDCQKCPIAWKNDYGKNVYGELSSVQCKTMSDVLDKTIVQEFSEMTFEKEVDEKEIHDRNTIYAHDSKREDCVQNKRVSGLKRNVDNLHLHDCLMPKNKRGFR